MKPEIGSDSKTKAPSRLLSSERALVDFESFFDRNEIQRLQDEFATATQVAAIITLPDGTPLTRASNFTPLHGDLLHEVAEKSSDNYFIAHAELGRHPPNKSCFHPGLSGSFWTASVSITVEGQHVANWLIAQVRNENSALDVIRAYAPQNDPEESGRIAAMPPMLRQQFESVVQHLFSFVSQLSTSAYLKHQQAQFIADEKKNKADLTRLSTAIEQSPETIVITDVDGLIQYVNPAFEKITGYTVDEILGKNPNVLKSGKQDEAFYQELWGAITHGVTWKGQLVNKRKDGTLYTEEATISPVLDEAGNVINYVAVKRDISEHLALAAQFEQAQKMESLGRLSGGIAHDFNNMLQIIVGHTELALDQTDPESSVFKDVQEIHKAAGRSTRLVRQLLTFARKQTISPQIVDLNETVEGMLKMLRRLLGEAINLLWNPGKNLSPIKIDPSQIDQLMTNLCINAQDAIEGVGTITLASESAIIDENVCANHLNFSPGEYTVLSVRDTGCGMSREILARVFEPFFTTKEVGKGTGLGLSTVYGVVKQNNGFIDVQSEPGHGSTFKIYFPQQVANAHPRQDALSARAKVQPMARGSETILLVEDEATILGMTTMMLKNLGYTVLSAASPAEAIRLASAHANRIDLLMTDVVMPGMNGKDLAEDLRSRQPDLKCLFMSGYSADIIAPNGVLGTGVHFIQKPFSLRDCAARVREVFR